MDMYIANYLAIFQTIIFFSDFFLPLCDNKVDNTLLDPNMNDLNILLKLPD